MSYIQGFVVPVVTDRKAEYVAMAEKAWPLFAEHGALSMTEGWGEFVPDGEVTSFPMAVKKADAETVVFSWIIWPDRQTSEACMEKMQGDERWQALMPNPDDAPFDMKRMIFGGFQPVFESERPAGT